MNTNINRYQAGEYLFPKEEMLATLKDKETLIIGLPKEGKKDENRVSLTPIAVKRLTDNGHKVIMESDAGKASNYTNQEYLKAGAKITTKRNNVYNADIILQVSPLSLKEIELLKGSQTIISSLYLANQKEENIKALIKKKITALSFELLKDNNDKYPIAYSIGEIAGNTAILVAAEYLSTSQNGKGIVLGSVTGISPTEVVILGSNITGESAARVALGLGATVKVFDNFICQLRELTNNIGSKIFTSTLNPIILEKALQTADVVIGAMRPNMNKPHFVVPASNIMKMKKGSIIIDLSVESGGSFETSKLTSFGNPTYTKHNVTHYCAPNITSKVARTTSIAISNILFPLLLEIGDAGNLDNHLQENIGTRNGIYIYNGAITNPELGAKFNLPYINIDLLLSSL